MGPLPRIIARVYRVLARYGQIRTAECFGFDYVNTIVRHPARDERRNCGAVVQYFWTTNPPPIVVDAQALLGR
jgi:hypothetical protein